MQKNRDITAPIYEDHFVEEDARPLVMAALNARYALSYGREWADEGSKLYAVLFLLPGGFFRSYSKEADRLLKATLRTHARMMKK